LIKNKQLTAEEVLNRNIEQLVNEHLLQLEKDKDKLKLELDLKDWQLLNVVQHLQADFDK